MSSCRGRSRGPMHKRNAVTRKYTQSFRDDSDLGKVTGLDFGERGAKQQLILDMCETMRNTMLFAVYICALASLLCAGVDPTFEFTPLLLMTTGL